MTGIISKLGLDSRSKTSRNVWLVFLFNFLLIGMNYMALMMPKGIFILLGLGLSLFGFISLMGYTFWTTKNWSAFRGGEKIKEVFYIGLMMLVTALFSLIPLKSLEIFLR
jgi:hypothetical protein